VYEAAYDPADLLEGSCNAAAMAWLDAPWPGGRLALWGEPGCGKTHLLHVWATRYGAVMLSGPTLTGLVTLPESGGLTVDQADAAPEEPLLHLLNAAAETGLPVLLAARHPPARWQTRLPDLASRLRAVTSVEVARPDDAMLRVLFTSLLAARQLVVPESVQDWLLLRLPRDPAALREAAALLDQAALAAGRRVTQAIAAQIIAEPAHIAISALDI
jgi:chromosomal replication initiation ATPase DnaA